jgi:ribosomal protein S27AE
MSAEEPDLHESDTDEPGDAVCWLHELCPVCGAMPTPEHPDRCWRCGHPVGITPSAGPGAG